MPATLGPREMSSTGLSQKDARDRELSYPEYWDLTYTDSDKTAQETGDGASVPTRAGHEWLRSFDDLSGFLLSHIPAVEAKPRLLHLGCGTSTVTERLLAIGYDQQINVDFSPLAIAHMQRLLPQLQWLEMDFRDMKGIADQSIDVAIDKGGLDAMVYGSPWSPPEEVKNNTGRYIREVARVLRRSGTWLCVSFRQPHFTRIILDAARPAGGDDAWASMEYEVLGAATGGLEYFGWVMRKK